MKEMKGRPVITGEDYPLTVYNALHASVAWNIAALIHENDPAAWQKQAQDAYGAVADAFPGVAYGEEPWTGDGETVIYSSTDQLEMALVAFGLGESRTDQEIEQVDQLLHGIDDLKQQLGG